MQATRDTYEQAARRFLKLLEDRNMEEWVELFTEDAANHFPFNFSFDEPEDVLGKEAIRENWQDFPAWFESVRLPIDEILVDEAARTVIVRADSRNIVRMAPENPWTAGGPTYNNRFVFLLRFDDDGKIVDFYEYYNAIVTGVASGMIVVSRRDEPAMRTSDAS